MTTIAKNMLPTFHGAFKMFQMTKKPQDVFSPLVDAAQRKITGVIGNMLNDAKKQNPKLTKQEYADLTARTLKIVFENIDEVEPLAAETVYQTIKRERL